MHLNKTVDGQGIGVDETWEADGPPTNSYPNAANLMATSISTAVKR